MEKESIFCYRVRTNNVFDDEIELYFQYIEGVIDFINLYKHVQVDIIYCND